MTMDMESRSQLVLQDLQVVSGLLSAMGADLFGGEPQFLDAGTLADYVAAQPFSDGLPYFAPNRPLLIGRIDSAAIAKKVQAALASYFPATHPVQLFWNAPARNGIEITQKTLGDIERHPYETSTYALIFPIDSLEASRSPLGLHALVSILRSPQGCPWDREQTHASIRSAVIEEAYEVADAIDEGDAEHLAEELGDLALQVALHAQIALEAGEFTPADVYGHVNRKLFRRHPHIFSDAIAATSDAVLETWEGMKAKERSAKGVGEAPSDPFDRLPRSMPVLTRVASVLKSKANSQPAAAAEENALGDQLLKVVEQLMVGGANPEAALEQAYRRRAVANPANL